MSVLEIMSMLDPKHGHPRVGCGGIPEIDWRDVCGALATLPKPQQDFAYLIHNPRSGQPKLALTAALGQLVYDEVKARGIQCRKQRLDQLCACIAASALYQVLHPHVCTTRAQRMAAGGITMGEEAYKQRWERFEQGIKALLLYWHDAIEQAFIQYMRATKRA